MPTYKYRATNSTKEIFEDTLVAANQKDAQAILTNRGLQLVSLKTVKEGQALKSRLGFKKTIPLLEKSTLFRYLATMVNAGLSLPEALEVYGQDSQYSYLRAILADVQQKLQQGKTLSEALARYPDSFEHATLAIIEAGEVSGTLTKSLNYLSKQLYAEYKLKQKVKGAMMYPVIIVGAMGGVGMMLVFFVLPKIAPIFLQLNVNMPAFSRIVLEGGLFISQNTVAVFSAMFVMAAATFVALTQKAGRQLALKIITIVPALKRLLDEIDLARFSRTLSTLLSSGVPITESLHIVVSSLTQKKFNQLADIFRSEVQKGKALSDVMRPRKKLFPAMVVRMIATGEKTGSVDSMLTELAQHYENEVDNTLANFTSVLEPVLLLLVGVGVGAMVLAVIAPIYSLVGGIEASTPGR